MARIKGALATRKRRNKTLKLAKGYWGGKSRLFKTAKEAVWKSGQYAYISRRLKKRDFRKLWIARINAACKMNGTNYSTLINGLKKANIGLNRKMLSEIAINDPKAFAELVKTAKDALNGRMPVQAEVKAEAKSEVKTEKKTTTKKTTAKKTTKVEE